ncbi:facilitated trehalose transporter Tret1-2 homolog isoform X2 [Chrysoperla carnea]|nr:facilitated trehalose transporter Tret1-2 homolog isoform X2 [Chrysoperla carnea]
MAPDENQKGDHQTFTEMIVSCRSLSYYEGTSIKTAFPQILASVFAASYHIAVGIALAYSAILIPQLEDPASDIKVTQSQSSWLASVIVVVVPVGSIIAGLIMERFGRLNTIKIAAVPSVCGWILIAMSTDFYTLLLGRLLTGLASALGSSPAIVYITEVARPDMRGSLISACPTLASLGMVLAYCKGWYLNWRLVAWLSNVYVLVPAVLVYLIPDSPVWLVSRGRIDDAKRSLDWLNRLQPQPERKTETLSEMQMQVLLKEREIKLAEKRNSSRGGSPFYKLREFLKPTGYKPLIILFFLFFFQQYSGIYITLFYAVTFFQESGSQFNPYLASILIGVVRLLMSMVNTLLLKRFHRRPCVMISAVSMAICMTVSGYFTYRIKQGDTGYSWMPVICLLLYVCSSMIGFLTIPWTMTAELFPTEIRGLAHSVSYSMANLLMFAAVQSYRDLNTILGGSHGVQWFFAVISILGAIYAFIFLPETQGKKLSDIQKYFLHNTIYFGSKNTPSHTTKKQVPRVPVKTDVEKGQTARLVTNVE